MIRRVFRYWVERLLPWYSRREQTERYLASVEKRIALEQALKSYRDVRLGR